MTTFAAQLILPGPYRKSRPVLSEPMIEKLLGMRLTGMAGNAQQRDSGATSWSFEATGDAGRSAMEQR
jgi:hypothetical protein